VYSRLRLGQAVSRGACSRRLYLTAAWHSLGAETRRIRRSQHRLTNGKHKLRIAWELREKPLRYGELKRAVNASGTTTIAERVFGRELKALAKCGLVERKAHASVVPKVEYSLTPLGSKLIPLIARIAKWGLQNLKDPSPS
jgi:DNA-binding HxlR family transcriptional regulator